MSVPSSYAQAVEAIEHGYPALCIPTVHEGQPTVVVSILRSPTREAITVAHDPHPPIRAQFHAAWAHAVRRDCGYPLPQG